MTYCCPDPTPDQILNATLLGYDADNRCGHAPFDTSACDILYAACLIHDETYLIGGGIDEFHTANAVFARNCMILAKACDDSLARLEAGFQALEYTVIVQTLGWQYWHLYDRNTDVTRAQGAMQMLDAKKWINECAAKIGEELPYLVVV